ncbi:flagellar protein FliT [Herbaspirillum sp. Sphag1AN]|uniref:flagellar protein FliT n=1 Tax=unclassified Herbaspirillum TaxID=2624150 RepID=UPI00180BDF0C|nr:flagellar protein FliT [Herbaspirillum sp. Sphag1AN]MBB3244637.1 flagellar protein FliT [Herbaspirillum sp. Sphag64]
MMDGAEVISLYESVADLTDQMLAAAREEDWNLLSKLEADCAHVVGVLKETEGAVTLTDDRRERKVKILKKILADDRDIRNLTDPGLKKLAALIHNTSTERKIASAYGVNPRG